MECVGQKEAQRSHGSGHGVCRAEGRGPGAEARKPSVPGMEDASKVRSWAACLGESMTFVLRSRMRIGCEQDRLAPSHIYFKKREKPGS